MEKLLQHSGLVAALDRVNVDTDQIIPKQFLKRIERTGFGPFLFHDWRLLEDGTSNPGFELNRPEFEGASILLTGDNFGCGSSREHAAWALREYGFRVIIAPSFADIFYNNCFKNSLLPVVLPLDVVSELFERVKSQPGYRLDVDLVRKQVRGSDDLQLSFAIDKFRRETLLGGLDDIARTLKHEDAIRDFEARRSDLPESL